MEGQPRRAPSPSKERYVTALASPDDAWVSVTDASRIGRRQEHTIRTWIREGLLPVHPERVGMNRRTRRVRISDLARLTPIVDREAAIATEIGQLDLPSIPRQQKEVLEAQRQIDEHLTTLQRDLATLQAHHHQAFTDLRRSMTAATEHQQQRLERLHIDLAGQIGTLQQALVLLENHQHQQIDTLHKEINTLNIRQQRALTEVQASTAAQIQDLHGLLELQQTALLDEHQKWETALTRQAEGQAQAQTHLREAVAHDLNTAVQHLHEHVDALIEQQARDLAAMSTHIGAIDTQLEQITTQVEAVNRMVLESQQRTESQDQKIADLQAQLRQETEARLALTQQVATLLATRPTPRSRKRETHT